MNDVTVSLPVATAAIADGLAVAALGAIAAQKAGTGLAGVVSAVIAGLAAPLAKAEDVASEFKATPIACMEALAIAGFKVARALKEAK